MPLKLGKVTYPFGAYGWDSVPHQENLLIKNATVWTNEKEGILPNTDVLVKNGKDRSRSGRIYLTPPQKYLMERVNTYRPVLLMSTHISRHFL
jgi:hypothetical protein